jgi:exopolysaccharide biosynthesis polyprenyl glycosylphosphotransferase
MGNPETLKYRILASDALVIVLATALAFTVRFSEEATPAALIGPIQVVGTLLPIFWLLVLVFMGSYDRRALFIGLSEYSRVVMSGVIVLSVISTVSFLLKQDTSRAYVLITIPLGVIGLLIERYIWRRWLLARRREGFGLAPTIIVGSPEERDSLAAAMLESPWAGYRVKSLIDRPENELDWEVWFEKLEIELNQSKATAIALAGSSASDARFVRELSWRIEGEGVDLLVGAGVGSTTGPRVTLRVASGLPLLHLDEVALRNTQRVAKRSLDLVGAAVGLTLLSPVLLTISLLILATSGPPILFRQKRAGRDHKIFRMWKFRTMVRDADSQRALLREEEGGNGPIFKADIDPRITPIGRFLRRWSLDELPQLFNVLAGEMSLVGPRPHPMDDVALYEDRDLRRLIAKPGMTGLWQVAGRSDLTWDASIELDLLYIENWTFLGDLVILARTVQAVLQGSGAR